MDNHETTMWFACIIVFFMASSIFVYFIFVLLQEWYLSILKGQLGTHVADVKFLEGGQLGWGPALPT